MGLDMYFYTEESLENGDGESFFYMRKENSVHGFFAEKYYESGNTDDFNCESFDVTDYLDELAALVKQRKLKPTAGFFFGSQDPKDIDYELIEKFLEEAYQLVKEGYRIIYYAWY